MRAAVIGIGKIGYSYTISDERTSHASSYLKCPETELVAVADVDRVKLEDFKIDHTDIAVYQDYEKMIHEVKPDIVSVATPTDTHFRIVRNVARFNCVKVIFCEKPISSTIEEAEKMVRTCKEFQVKLAVNHTRRYDPAYRLIKGILGGEWRNLPKSCVQGARSAKEYARWDIGELLAFDGRFSSGPIREGVHMTDLFNWYKGKNTKLGLLNVPTPYLVFELDLVGSDGWITVRGNGSDIRLWKPEPSKRYAWLNELRHITNLEARYDFSRAMLNVVDDLVECTTSDKQPECDGKCGLEALKLCQEVFKGGN